MLTSHRVIPLPAYDTKGNLIQPKNYKNALAGALVRINFKLSHWHINSQPIHTHSFVADIVSIRVLIPPITSTTLTKRKTSKRDPEINLSSKKKKKIIKKKYHTINIFPLPSCILNLFFLCILNPIATTVIQKKNKKKDRKSVV